MSEVVSQLQREHEGERVPCIVFTKGGGLWLEQIAASAATRSGWTGLSTWARRAGALTIAARCRATSIRWPCSRRTSHCARRCAACWMLSVRRAVVMVGWGAMSSISGTEFRSSRHRNRSPYWSMRCIDTAGPFVGEWSLRKWRDLLSALDLFTKARSARFHAGSRADEGRTRSIQCAKPLIFINVDKSVTGGRSELEPIPTGVCDDFPPFFHKVVHRLADQKCRFISNQWVTCLT